MIDDTPPSLTDREFSVEAEEFVWDEPGLSAVHALVLDRILAALTIYKIRRVLDVGCGNGAASQRLANTGFEVVGLDSSSSGIALARAKTSTVQFEQHDIAKPLPYELRGDFDAVVAIEVIEHLFKPRELLRRAAEGLRPAGIVILTTPYHGYLKNLAIAAVGKFDHHVHPLRDYGHIKFFSPATLSKLVRETGFEVESIQRVGRIPALAKSMILVGRLNANGR